MVVKKLFLSVVHALQLFHIYLMDVLEEFPRVSAGMLGIYWGKWIGVPDHDVADS